MFESITKEMISTPTVIAAIVAFGGVIVSVCVSLIITIYTTRSEIRKLRASLRNQYASTLMEKRLSMYGDVYYLLSNIAKRIRRYLEPDRPISYKDISEFNKSLSEWDSRNALLLSPKSVDVMHTFRRHLRELLNKGEEEFIANSPDVLDALISGISKLEAALRNDVGIYHVDEHEQKQFFMSNAKFVKDLERRKFKDLS